MACGIVPLSLCVNKQLSDSFVLTSMNEVPQSWMDFQPFAVCPKIPLIAWSLADGFIGAGAALRGLERSPGYVPSVCNLIVVAARQASGCSPVGVSVDLLALSCRNSTGERLA